MPMRPEVFHRLTPLLVVVLLAGCVTTPESEERTGDTPDPVLQELAGLLPGHYVTPTQADSSQVLALEVVADPAAAHEQLRLLMIQTRMDRPDDPPRQFEWLLESAGNTEDRLIATFAPMDRAGRIQRRCGMQVTVRRDGLTSQTDPQECRFGEGEQLTGLLKEIAFDGSQIVIGDRLISIPGGEPQGNDQVTRFMLSRHFSGWAGVREGGDWRMASTISLQTGLGSIEPHDAARMDLGLRVELNHYLMRRTDEVKLRLSVTDTESGQLLGEAWADADARSIGIALPDLQVGLEMN